MQRNINLKNLLNIELSEDEINYRCAHEYLYEIFDNLKRRDVYEDGGFCRMYFYFFDKILFECSNEEDCNFYILDGVWRELKETYKIDNVDIFDLVRNLIIEKLKIKNNFMIAYAQGVFDYDIIS